MPHISRRVPHISRAFAGDMGGSILTSPLYNQPMPLLSYPEAAKQITSFAQNLAPRTSETVPLARSFGRILATPLHADRDQPPFPRSTRDGFACLAADANHHRPLPLTGRLRAGQIPQGVLKPGEAWEIMTGAPVPQGADAVFMVEHAEVTDTTVRLPEPRTIASGENIVPRAAEARQGDALLPAGIRIAAAQIALAAQCGHTTLTVFTRPRVAILSTGDELVPVESTPGPSQVRNSNSPMLAALVAAAGGDPLICPTVADNESAVDAAIQSILAAFPDMILVTGGISAGRFDLVEQALIRAGAQFSFHGVAIQPGKPVAFGQISITTNPHSREAPSHGRPVLALPGNPISSAVTFHLFAAPLLAALSGSTNLPPYFASATLTDAWRGKPGLTRFLPAHCDFALDHRVSIVAWQGSGDLAAFARSNCFAVIPSQAHDLPEGTLIQILLP